MTPVMEQPVEQFLRRIMRLLILLCVCFVLVVLLAWVFQRKMIYFPFTGAVSPAATILPDAREVTVDTEDGLQLGAWYIPPGDDRDPVVIVFNGNAGDRSMRAGLARALAGDGFGVLLFDYRGYGGNPGTPTENGLHKDARAVRAWLLSKTSTQADHLFYFGESLGTGVAVKLAAESPPAALILRSPLTSLVDVGRKHYPIFPVSLLLKDRFSSIDLISRVGCPVLVIAGERDGIVPAEMSRRLFDTAIGPKELLIISGADHNDDVMFDGRELVDTTAAFIRKYAVPSGE